jgi:hypothetical protein
MLNPTLPNVDPNASPPQQGQVAPGGQPNNLGQVAGPPFPDWLLKTERGPIVDNNKGVVSTKANAGASAIQLYRLRYMFGSDQTVWYLPGGRTQVDGSQSWSSPIAYLLLLAAQIDLWNHFLSDNYPNQTFPDPTSTSGWPDMSTFATYCGATEYMHARHGSDGGGGAHARGNAVDVEYFRSPYLPLHSDGWGDFGGYSFDKSSYVGSVSYDPKSSNYIITRLVSPCVTILERAYGQPSPHIPNMVAPDFAFTTPIDTIVAWYDQLAALNTAVKTYFANGANANDSSTLVYGTPMGNTTVNPDGTFSGPSRGNRTPSTGIVGFTRQVVASMLGAQVSFLQAIVPFQDATLQQAMQKYSFKWAPFSFGSDLQHFDIERWNYATSKSNAPTPPPDADQQLAQTSIENGLSTRTSYDKSNNGPWFDGETQWPDPKNGNVLV